MAIRIGFMAVVVDLPPLLPEAPPAAAERPVGKGMIGLSIPEESPRDSG